MATATMEPLNPIIIPNPTPRRVCFSFAAYAKNLIHHLDTANVPVADGLTEAEFSAIESTFHFTFHPDLRSILQEGLPVGAGFPNWRSSSTQQLQILMSLPILGICREVARGNFWVGSWGDRPEDGDEAVDLAKRFLRDAPVLVPIYRHCYIPATPCLAGNPVFYVNGGDVKLWSFDVAGFFQRVEFRRNEAVLRRPSLSNLLNSPAWAATEARRIEFWTELAEGGAARAGTRRWWSGDLGGYLEEVCWRLRDGGWKEEDVREMMMIDGGDEADRNRRSRDNVMRDNREAVVWHVRLLSLRLLRAGWSSEDVVDSLGFPEDQQRNGGPDGEYWFDFQKSNNFVDEQNRNMKQLMNMHSIEV